MNNIVAPSLLSCDFLNIEKEVNAFEQTKDLWLHLDIMDGHFVPNLTFGLPIVKKISKITNIPLDAHFMVTNPEFHLNAFKDSGIHNFTFHYEACPQGNEQVIELIKKAKKIYPSVGLSLRPKTPLNVLSDQIFQNLDLLLVMSVEPGFGGQSFIEGTWDKLKELQKKSQELELNLNVQVDGGVSSENAKKLREYGANNLVAGSFIFKGGESQYQKNIQLLR